MAPKKPGKARSGLSHALEYTMHPQGNTVLNQLLTKHGNARSLISKILDGPCVRPIRNCHHARCVKVTGRINTNLHGAWVFGYDQRMSSNEWDEFTVLCRGLLVIFPRSALLAEGFPEASVSIGHKLDSDLLRRLCTSGISHPCRVIEPMPKFWEGGTGGGELSWDDVVSACGNASPQLIRIEDKVDGNLGMLYPQFDHDLNPMLDVAPLLATKGVGHSIDIERQMRMLHSRYPLLRFPAGVSHVIIEIIEIEMKVVVPYTDEDVGARLIAGSDGQSWLSHEALDMLGNAWSLPRPCPLPLFADATFQMVQERADQYEAVPGQLLAEGFVVHMACSPLADVIRLKVHTHVWRVVHGWWEDNPKSKHRVTIGTVMPVLTDMRFTKFGVAGFEPCLVMYRPDDGPHSGSERVRQNHIALKFREAVARARGCLDECLSVLGDVVVASGHLPRGRELPNCVEKVVVERLGLDEVQQRRLGEFVLCLRQRLFPDPLTAEQISQLPHALSRTFGEPYVDDNRSELDRSLHQIMQQAMANLMAAWTAAAQIAWESELPADEA